MKVCRNWPSGPKSPAELQMASQGRVRQSLLMLSWALALADQDFASSERQRLHAFANGLKLSQAEIQAAETAAQDYVLDQAMRTAFQFGHDDYARQHIYQLGSRIGMSQDKIAMAEAQFTAKCITKGQKHPYPAHLSEWPDSQRAWD